MMYVMLEKHVVEVLMVQTHVVHQDFPVVEDLAALLAKYAQMEPVPILPLETAKSLIQFV